MNTQGNHYVNMDETVIYENVNTMIWVYLTERQHIGLGNQWHQTR